MYYSTLHNNQKILTKLLTQRNKVPKPSQLPKCLEQLPKKKTSRSILFSIFELNDNFHDSKQIFIIS